MERNPLNIAYSLFISWTGTLGTVVFENINSILAVACGLASLIASVYAVALSRERLRQLEQCGQCEHRQAKRLPRLDHLGVIFLALVPIAALIGCSSIPTQTDRAWFKVVTNQVPQVVAVTNQPPPMPVVAAVTNEQTGAIEVVTNYIPLPPVVRLVTNYVALEELAPDPATEATIRDAGGAIGAFWGLGGMSAALAGGLYHLLLQLRNRRIHKALIQGIETAREIIKTTPQGQQLEGVYKEWLMEDQRNANLLLAISRLVEKTADNQAARDVAAFLADETKPTQPTQ